jgi:adenosylcobinamide-GDP ribazoletransferase
VIRGLRYAVSLLTILRVRSDAPTRDDARWAMLWAPVVGFALSFVAALVVFFFRKNAPSDATPMFAAVFGIGTLAVLTRGLHLDGLADTADGLGAGSADVMRQGDVGPFGVVTVVLVLLVQVAALASCVTVGRGTSALLVSGTVGRLAATLSCTPRTPGLGSGLGATVAGAVPRAAAFTWTALLLGGVYVLGAMDEGIGLNSGAHAVAAAVLGLAAAHALRARCVRRFGGVNGDVLGAQVETAVTVVLVVMALQTWR